MKQLRPLLLFFALFLAGCRPAGSESEIIPIPALPAATPIASPEAAGGGLVAIPAAAAPPSPVPAGVSPAEELAWVHPPGVDPALCPIPLNPFPTPAPGDHAFEPRRFFLPPGLPAPLREMLNGRLAADPFWELAASPAEGDVQLLVDGGVPLGRWVYAVAAPFPTVRDEISWAELQSLEAVWGSEETVGLWRERLPNGVVYPGEDLVEALWSRREMVALVPFDELTPDLKVLRIDGVSPFDGDFDAGVYPLSLRLGLSGRGEQGEAAVREFLASCGPLSNRDESRLTRLSLTGVTALVRATAFQMEINGVNFPAGEVGPLLAAADVTHISNEIPFVTDCPYPDPASPSLVFCSRDGYFEILETVGADVIELTGNHANDYGPEQFLHTLDLYEAAGMVTYGGGRNLEHARQPAIVEHNGHRLAFVGCNPVGPVGGFATAERAGMNPCDYVQLTEQIAALKREGYTVIATFQYFEHYDYRPTAEMVADFGRVAAAGADIVSGSQAHVPHGFAFVGSSFIHYGLGNLFFDQMDRLDTRQMFIDQYVLYDGRLLGVELWTGLIESYARPRAMTPEERRLFLEAIFAASGW